MKTTKNKKVCMMANFFLDFWFVFGYNLKIGQEQRKQTGDYGHGKN